MSISGPIERQEEFEELCRHIRQCGIAAFDTEFVSEYTYQPELCLLQFATPERTVCVDPLPVADLSPWWRLMADDETTVVVHAGQAEVGFCLRLSGLKPNKLVDIQVAEGLRSRSFPLGYSTIVERVLHERAHGKETRTDWCRRPLSRRQIDYALEDVKYILPVWERQRAALEALGRLAWAEVEFQRLIDETAEEMSREPWQRVPGVQNLGPRELAAARELARWRDQLAAQRNKPPRRILRDDLLLDIARRRPKTERELMRTRDMTRSNYKRLAGEILDCVRRADDLPEADLPQPPVSLRRTHRPEEHVLSQLLGIALSNRCAEINCARQLVGTSADLRELVRWHVFEGQTGSPPRLATGWRAEVCGNLLTDLLDGKVSLRVADPCSDHPLVFERR